MSLFMIGMMGVVALHVRSAETDRVAAMSTRAAFLLQAQMDRMSCAEYDDHWLRDTNKGNNHTLFSARDVDYENIDADGNTIESSSLTLIRNVADDKPIPDTKTIVAMVLWDEGKHELQSACIKSKLDSVRPRK